MSDLEPAKLKVVELRAELSARGLDTKGNKAVLIKRLEDAINLEAEEGNEGSNGDGSEVKSEDSRESIEARTNHQPVEEDEDDEEENEEEPVSEVSPADTPKEKVILVPDDPQPVNASDINTVDSKATIGKTVIVDPVPSNACEEGTPDNAPITLKSECDATVVPHKESVVASEKHKVEPVSPEKAVPAETLQKPASPEKRSATPEKGKPATPQAKGQAETCPDKTPEILLKKEVETVVKDEPVKAPQIKEIPETPQAVSEALPQEQNPAAKEAAPATDAKDTQESKPGLNQVELVDIATDEEAEAPVTTTTAPTTTTPTSVEKNTPTGNNPVPMEHSDIKSESGRVRNRDSSRASRWSPQIKMEPTEFKREYDDSKDDLPYLRRSSSRSPVKEKPPTIAIDPKIESFWIKEEEKAKAPSIDDLKVVLDSYNSDLNLTLDDTATGATPLTKEGFAFVWAGARASYGIKSGRACFEVKIIDHLDVAHLPSDELNPHVVRVGFSCEHTSMQLGEETMSWGFGGTGKASTDCKFKNYGVPFAQGDVVTAFVDMDHKPVELSFAVNGRHLGSAYKIPADELRGMALYPHVLTKNCQFQVNFGQMEEPLFPLPAGFEDYTFVGTIPLDQMERGTVPPKKRSECEMLMMCGLPGCGKTTWADDYCQKHPEKKYNVLGTNSIIDKMKVMGLPRKRNYSGRWEVLIQMSTKCLNALFAIGSKKFRNYILDQTNVYPSAQRRKMSSFVGFRRVAVVIVPTDEEFTKRVEKRVKEDGTDIPESAVMEMKANFGLPLVGELFDEVLFTELQRSEADALVRKYNAEGETRFPPNKRFRPNDNSRGGHSPRGGSGGGYGDRDRDRSGDRDRFGGDRGRFGDRGRGGRFRGGDRGRGGGDRGRFGGDRDRFGGGGDRDRFGGGDRDRGGGDRDRDRNRSRDGFGGGRGGFRGGPRGGRGDWQPRGSFRGGRGGSWGGDRDDGGRDRSWSPGGRGGSRDGNWSPGSGGRGGGRDGSWSPGARGGGGYRDSPRGGFGGRGGDRGFRGGGRGGSRGGDRDSRAGRGADRGGGFNGRGFHNSDSGASGVYQQQQYGQQQQPQQWGQQAYNSNSSSDASNNSSAGVQSYTYSGQGYNPQAYAGAYSQQSYSQTTATTQQQQQPAAQQPSYDPPQYTTTQYTQQPYAQTGQPTVQTTIISSATTAAQRPQQDQWSQQAYQQQAATYQTAAQVPQQQSYAGQYDYSQQQQSYYGQQK